MKRIYFGLASLSLMSACSDQTNKSIDNIFVKSPLMDGVLAVSSIGESDYYKVSHSYDTKYFYTTLSTQRNQMVEIKISDDYRVLSGSNNPNLFVGRSGTSKSALDDFLGTGEPNFYLLIKHQGYGKQYQSHMDNPHSSRNDGAQAILERTLGVKVVDSKKTVFGSYPLSITSFKPIDPSSKYAAIYSIVVPGEDRSVVLFYYIAKGAPEPDLNSFLSEHIRFVTIDQYERELKGKSNRAQF